MEEPLFLYLFVQTAIPSYICISILCPHNYNLNASLSFSLTDVSLSNTYRAKA